MWRSHAHTHALRALRVRVRQIGGTGRDGGNDNIRLAAPLPPRVLGTLLAAMTSERVVVLWSSSSKAVVARRQRRVGCLVLSSEPCALTDDAALPALLQVRLGLMLGGNRMKQAAEMHKHA